MSDTSKTEILFYYLERTPLERVLPGLLEKSLDRKWRIAVQSSSDTHIDALDMMLWTYREDSFLPHGTTREKNAHQQPILLTSSEENPNQADIRFFVDGVIPQKLNDIYVREVYLFDGYDEILVERMRELWRSVKDQGYPVSYWYQDERGAWKNKA